MTRNPHKTMVQSKLPSPIYDHTPYDTTSTVCATRFNDMTKDEQVNIASNLLEVAKSHCCSRYVLQVIDAPRKLYNTDNDIAEHYDTDLSHMYVVNALADMLMTCEVLGYHDLVVIYIDQHGYMFVPGRYS